jgi:hypothetical protein
MQTLEDKIQYNITRSKQEIMEYYDELDTLEKGSEIYIWRRNEIRTMLITYLKNLKMRIKHYYEMIQNPSDYMMFIASDLEMANTYRNFQIYFMGSSVYKHRITVYDIIRDYYEAYIVQKNEYLCLLNFL